MNRYYVKDNRTGEKRVVDADEDLETIQRWYPGTKVKPARNNLMERNDESDRDGAGELLAEDLGF